MLSLSRKTDLALVALADLARRAPEGASARQISERYEIPLPMLMNVLKQLMRQGLVDSSRGTKGGYRLALPPGQITLADIITVFEGPLQLTQCCSHAEPAAHEDESGACGMEPRCPTKEPIRKVQAMFERFLRDVTLASIVSDTVPLGLRLAHGTDRAYPPAAEACIERSGLQCQ